MILDGESTSWVKNSPHLLAGKKCIALVDGEYRRQHLHYDDKERNIKNNSRRSYAVPGVTPRNERERTIVYGFFVSFFSEEVHERKFNIKDAAKVVEKLSTVITKSTDIDVKTVDTDVVLMSSIIGKDCSIDEIRNVIDKSVPESADSLMENALDDDTSNQCTKATEKNTLALTNIFEMGEIELNKNDFPKMRKNKQARLKREEEFLMSIYEKVLNESNSTKVTENKLVTSDFEIPEYRKQLSGNKEEVDYNHVIEMCMKSVWNKTPRAFQYEAIESILRMKDGTAENKATLLVQGTGGGKSAVMQTLATLLCGVTIVFENTLSLSTDQLSKINVVCQTNGMVKGYHLDTIRDVKDQQLLVKNLSTMKAGGSASIILFISPEVIQKEIWNRLVEILFKNNVLNLICIDEVHQFVNFGISFRYSFPD